MTNYCRLFIVTLFFLVAFHKKSEAQTYTNTYHINPSYWVTISITPTSVNVTNTWTNNIQYNVNYTISITSNLPAGSNVNSPKVEFVNSSKGASEAIRTMDVIPLSGNSSSPTTVPYTTDNTALLTGYNLGTAPLTSTSTTNNTQIYPFVDYAGIKLTLTIYPATGGAYTINSYTYPPETVIPPSIPLPVSISSFSAIPNSTNQVNLQ